MILYSKIDWLFFLGQQFTRRCKTIKPVVSSQQVAMKNDIQDHPPSSVVELGMYYRHACFTALSALHKGEITYFPSNNAENWLTVKSWLHIQVGLLNIFRRACCIAAPWEDIFFLTRWYTLRCLANKKANNFLPTNGVSSKKCWVAHFTSIIGHVY